MVRPRRIGGCVAVAAATAVVTAAPAPAAIWVTVDPPRAPVGATVRVHAEYVPEPVRLFLARESVFEARSQPVLVTVGDGVEVRPSGAPPFRVGMAPSTLLEELEEERAGLVFFGGLVADDSEGGTTELTVPDVRAGTYRILVHCASCADEGGSLLWGETLVVERSGAPAWLLVAGATAGALVAAAGTVWLVRRLAARSRAETPA